MEDDTYAMDLYDEILKEIVYPLIGHKKTTSNFELDKAGKHIFEGSNFNWKGVFSSDKIPKILNLLQQLLDQKKSLIKY